jgi:hypothetical protein
MKTAPYFADLGFQTCIPGKAIMFNYSINKGANGKNSNSSLAGCHID